MTTKREFKYFTIFAYEKEQDYLREMHKSGWKFVRVSGFGMYHFKKCEPEDVVYQLDYNKEGLAHKEEYIQMFQDCGWEYLQEYVGYSYFRKSASEMNGNEEIFCDDSSRLHMMERVFKGRMVPLFVLFFAVLLPQFCIQISMHNYSIAFMVGLVLILYIVVFAAGAKKYWEFRGHKRDNE